MHERKKAGKRVVLIGQAPSRSTEGSPAFTRGRSAVRLAMLLGIEPHLLWRYLDMRNLLDRWPGRTTGNGGMSPDGKRRHGGDHFPIGEARRSLGAMLPELCVGRKVILAGRAVARCFGEPYSDQPFFRWVPYHDGLIYLAIMPHPSGVNHWWNTRERVVLASTFLRRAVFGTLGEGKDARA